MYTVFRKELADYLESKRFAMLFILATMAAVFAVYLAVQNIRGAVSSSSEFVFLKIFTVSSETLPSFLFFVSIFIPIIGIAFGFDAINNERASGNLSRLLSQPIYRDSIINGKFLASLAVLSFIVVSVIAIVGGLGLRIIGVPPDSEEVLRLIAFALTSIIYGAFWVALAILFSVSFNRAASSMLAALALWMFFFFFVYMIAGAIADARVPIDSNSSFEMIAKNAEIQGMINRISPCNLYGESILALLTPEIASLNPALMMISVIAAGRMLTPLNFTQSLLLVWPQIVTMVALATICFAISYVRFIKQEIRAT
ncbi:MAG: ABC transporter permease [Dehalococcoidia bacterium]|nr:ABC transporter permease [Dehalococcoidia bacterium]